MGDGDSEMIGVAEVARLLGVSRMTVHRMITKGKLHPVTEKNPHLERPRRVEFKRVDVERLMRESRPGDA